jgi:hypothetical protein
VIFSTDQHLDRNEPLYHLYISWFPSAGTYHATDSPSVVRLFLIVEPAKELGIVAETVIIRAYPLLLRICGGGLAKVVEVAQKSLCRHFFNWVMLQIF